MSSNLLLEHFDKLVDGGIDIPRFRKVIIALAIQGELDAEQTTQAAIDAALRKIESARVALVAAGVVKKHKSLPPLGEDDIPFAISERTHCERLADVARIEKGLTGIQSAEPGAFPLVVTADARATCDHYDFDGCAAIVPMVSSAGHGKASLKRLHYQEGKFALGNILCAVFPFSEEVLSARFIFEYLSAYKDELLVTRMIGTANVSLTLNKIGEVPIPIVSKKTQSTVHELMALCDRLEAAQQQREAERTRLTAAAWQAVVQAEAPAEVSFALEQLPALTTRPAQVKALRQTILDLAVRGRLVEQVEGDGRDGVAVRPQDWPVRRLDEVFVIERGGSPRPIEDYLTDDPDGLNWVKISDATASGKYITATKERIRPEGLKKTRMVYAGDFLLTNSMSFGRPYIMATTGCIHDGWLVFRDKDGLFDKEYLYNLLSSSLINDEFNRLAAGALVKNLNIKLVGSVEVPIPPLAEQRRIVAKVEELMALCDGLEAALEAGEALRGQVLEAVVRSEAGGTEPPAPVRVRQLPVPKVRAPRYEEAEVELAVAAEPVGHTGAMQAVVRRGPGRPPKNGALTSTAARAIEAYLHAHPGWHGKAVLLEATGVDTAAWNAAIKELLEGGKVERQGEKKGARYRIS